MLKNAFAHGRKAGVSTLPPGARRKIREFFFAFFPASARKRMRRAEARRTQCDINRLSAHSRRAHDGTALPVFATIVTAMALAWAGCSGKPAATPTPVVAVQVAMVQRKTMERMITTDALLYPLNQATIVPKISAPVREFYVSRSSRVHQGQLLAVLENKDLSALVVESQGAYDQAKAAYATSTEITLPAQIQAAELTVNATKQAMEANRAVYQSRLKLYKAGAMARNLMNQSLVTYIQARNQYQIAESNLKALQSIGKEQQLKSAQAALASAQGKYLAAKAQLKYSRIRSPIAGVVTSSPLYPGEMASAGTPLITVMNVSRVVARAHIAPHQAAWLRPGDPATISLGSGQDAVRGKVTVVSPALDPSSTTVQVWIEAPNPDLRLKPGATIQVNMVAQTIHHALAVPAAAVLTDSGGNTSVMVVGPDSIARQTAVKIGIREGRNVQILSGLESGERVVTEGAYGLPDGTKVKY